MTDRKASGTMSNTLSVRVSVRKSATGDTFEGTANILGVRPTKLVRQADNTTVFPTRSAVIGRARNVAKALGYSDVTIVDANAPVAAKKAAKKSSVTNKTTAVKTSATPKITSTSTTTTKA